jgi:paraquat-inducible protein B
MGKFPKGHKKPENSGRKPNTPNKITREVKEIITELETLLAPIYYDKMIEKANSKDPKEVENFMDRFEFLTEFVIPKLSRSEVKAEVKTEITEAITKAFEGLDDEAIQP